MKAFAPCVAALLLGCADTDPAEETILTTDVAAEAVGAALHGATLVAELGAVWAAPVERIGGCPSLSRDGERWTARYAEPCVPDAGHLSASFVGTVDATVPTGTGLFDGTATGFGPEDAASNGTFTGSASTLPGLLTADVDFEDLSWTLAGTEQGVAGLIGISLEDGSYDIDADGLAVRSGPLDELIVDLDAVQVAAAPFSRCDAPVAGTARVQIADVEGVLDFTVDGMTLTLRGRDPVALLALCP